MIIDKKTFIEYIDFIKRKDDEQVDLCNVFEKLCPHCYCHTYVYDEYASMLIKLLETMFNDKTNLINYKLYEFEYFEEENKKEQIEETPEVETWETVYDYLINNLNERKDNDEK